MHDEPRQPLVSTPAAVNSPIKPDAPEQKLPAADVLFLAEAAAYLEHPGLLMRLANLVGKPVEALLGTLPSRAHDVVNHAASAALTKGLDWAVRSLAIGTADSQPSAVADVSTIDAASVEKAEIEVISEAAVAASASATGERPASAAVKEPPTQSTLLSARAHTALAATTGAVGGFFGLAGLGIEVPATTLVMLRSIAAEAARQGADLADPSTRLQCLSVLSFGSPAVEQMESAYFTARVGMALAVRESAQFVAKHTSQEVAEAVARGTAPSLVRLLGIIAGRFEVVLTEKVAAQMVPLAGAATGALINAAFTDHFNAVARYHFGILRLERQYGADLVRSAYDLALAKTRPLSR